MVETCEKQTNEGETDTVYQHVEDGSDGEGVDDVEVGNKNTSADPTLNSFNSQIANMRTRSGSLSKWDQLRLRNLQEKKDLWMKEMEKPSNVVPGDGGIEAEESNQEENQH